MWKDRYKLSIRHMGTNGPKEISSYGENIWEVIENMLTDELDYFENEYENNNFATGGHTAFTEDERLLYEQLNEIRNDLRKILGWNNDK